MKKTILAFSFLTIAFVAVSPARATVSALAIFRTTAVPTEQDALQAARLGTLVMPTDKLVLGFISAGLPNDDILGVTFYKYKGYVYAFTPSLSNPGNIYVVVLKNNGQLVTTLTLTSEINPV